MKHKGVTYREVEATLKLPDITGNIPFAQDAFAVRLVAGPSNLIMAAVVFRNGQWTPSLQWSDGGSGSAITLAAGHSVTRTVFYNPQSLVQRAYVTDNTTSTTFSGGTTGKTESYPKARAGFTTLNNEGPFTAPAADFRLALLTSLAVYQRNLRKVDLATSSQVKLVNKGTDEVDAPTLTHSNTSLGVWVRASG